MMLNRVGTYEQRVETYALRRVHVPLTFDVDKVRVVSGTAGCISRYVLKDHLGDANPGQPVFNHVGGENDG